MAAFFHRKMITLKSMKGFTLQWTGPLLRSPPQPKTQSNPEFVRHFSEYTETRPISPKKDLSRISQMLPHFSTGYDSPLLMTLLTVHGANMLEKEYKDVFSLQYCKLSILVEKIPKSCGKVFKPEYYCLGYE